MKLGQLISVDIREVWKHEERDFNRWLANEGMELLAKELGFENMEVERLEANAGDFFVDIVAKVSDFEGEKTVIIEAQLSKTDHDHLGKLITYSALYSANYLVWITPEIREEHRKAVDWLNNIAESSDEDIGFFLVKIEVWRIGDSAPAPKFFIVSAPNDWAKTVKKGMRGSSTLGEKGALAFEFFTGFYEYISDKIRTARPPKPSTPSFYELRLGTSKAAVRIGVSVSSGYIRIGIVFTKDLFERFKGYEEELRKLFEGEEFVLESPENYKKYAYADVFKRGVNFTKREKWESYYEWMYENYKKLKGFFEEHKSEILG